jgi:methylglyoxal synthase
MMPKRLALIAHDNLKPALMDWARRHRSILAQCDLVATGTSGARVEEATGLPVVKFKSGPLGGDQQIGARVAEGLVDLIVFFWDPMSPHPHDVDVKALLRIAALYNVPIACNPASADLMITAFG